jgi:hypothetical protein
VRSCRLQLVGSDVDARERRCNRAFHFNPPQSAVRVDIVAVPTRSLVEGRAVNAVGAAQDVLTDVSQNDSLRPITDFPATLDRLGAMAGRDRRILRVAGAANPVDRSDAPDFQCLSSPHH